MDTMGSSGAPFPPISNYKGVMLCDRPSADIGPKKPAPFNSAVVPPEQLGLAPAKRINVHSTEHKPKDKDSILYKHKQYLAALKKDIAMQKEAEAAIEGAEAAKKARFVERSAQLRDAIRAGILAQAEDEDFAEARNTSPPAEEPAAPVAEPEPEQPKAPVVPGLKLPTGGGHPGAALLNKPAWALTEDQAEEKDELQEEVDVDELLDFVEDLDFEAYVDDEEVQLALEIMRSRVTQLNTQRTERSEGDGEGDGEKKVTVVVRPESEAEGEEGWDNSVAGGDEEDGDEKGAVQAAKELLGSSRKLRQVHSTASIAKRLQALQEEEEEAQAMLDAQSQPKKKEVDPSNLPYLYRNPAV